MRAPSSFCSPANTPYFAQSVLHLQGDIAREEERKLATKLPQLVSEAFFHFRVLDFGPQYRGGPGAEFS